MKPVTLKIKAFISYKDEQIIDFTRFTQGLFLIEGDIGAGKTTIFDAMSFALYGAASGSERDESTGILHCNQISKKEDTVVDLTFIQSGKEYRAVRKIHFSKVRGTVDEYGDPKVQAFLYKQGELITEGASKVTSKVIEIIGLNKAQFRQIVMLAQGEFKEFLKADSDQKYEILKRIFDTNEYERYQNLLSGAQKKLYKMREGYSKVIGTHMNNSFVNPPEEDGFEDAMFVYGSPELSDNLETLVASDNAKFTILKDEYDKKDKAYTDLNTVKGKAEGDNANIDELLKQRIHLEDLIGKKSEMDTLRSRFDSVSVVVNKILDAIRTHDKLADKDESLAKEIAKLELELAQIQEDVKASEELVRSDKASVAEVEKLKSEVASLETLLTRYDEYDSLMKNAEKRTVKIEKDKTGLKNKKEELEKITALKVEALAKKEALGNAEEKKSEAGNKLKECRDRSDRFKDISGRFDDVLSKEKSLADLADEYRRLEGEVKEKKAVYDEKYSAFISSQASVIADDVKKKIDEDGFADCPVCGTHLLRGSSIKFAHSDIRVTQEDVDDAKRIFSEAEKSRSDLHTRYESVKSALDTRKEQILKDCSGLFEDCKSWDDLTSDYLDACSLRLEDELDRSAAELKQRINDYDESIALTKKIDGLSEQTVNLSNEISSLSTGIDKETSEMEGWKENASKIKSELKYETRDEAQAQIDSNVKSASELQKTIDEHASVLNKRKSDLAVTETSLNEKKIQKENNDTELASAKKKLTEVLAENHFSTGNDALAIIDDIGEPDKWLESTKGILAKYDYDVKNTSEKIAELEQKTKGIVKVDMQELNDKIREALAVRDECSRRLSDRKMLLDNHTSTLALIKEKNRELAGTERAWEKLNRLGILAVGTNSEGGRLSFDRYVMSANFKAILQEANIRLDILTGGAYQLKYKSTGNRQNEKAGLDVEIENMNDSFADTSATISKASLSGGEKFLTSLALALGLSEVAQQRYGGQTLDSLFIDEGFGTLDEQSLELTMKVLTNLTNNHNRLVGIISHVDSVDNYIPQKIIVRKRNSCSYIDPQT